MNGPGLLPPDLARAERSRGRPPTRPGAGPSRSCEHVRSWHRRPFAGSPTHRADYLEDEDGFAVELVAGEGLPRTVGEGASPTAPTLISSSETASAARAPTPPVAGTSNVSRPSSVLTTGFVTVMAATATAREPAAYACWASSTPRVAPIATSSPASRQPSPRSPGPRGRWWSA